MYSDDDELAKLRRKREEDEKQFEELMRRARTVAEQTDAQLRRKIEEDEKEFQEYVRRVRAQAELADARLRRKYEKNENKFKKQMHAGDEERRIQLKSQLEETKQRRKAEEQAKKVQKNAEAAQIKAERILELQRQEFNRLVRRYSYAHSERLLLIQEMINLLAKNGPEDLWGILHKIVLGFAERYVDGTVSEVSEDAESKILNYLVQLPPSESVAIRMQHIFLKRITNILLSDSQKEKPTRFQEDSLTTLGMMINNELFNLRIMKKWVMVFIEDSSRIPFRDKYITNRGDKVEQLEKCMQDMENFMRASDSMVVQNQPVYEANVDGSAENNNNNNNNAMSVRHSPVPPIDYPPVENANHVPLVYAFPNAGTLANYLETPRPVEHAKDASGPPFAQLAANIRRYESHAPVGGADELQRDVDQDFFAVQKVERRR